jgi:hypothetical protein
VVLVAKSLLATAVDPVYPAEKEGHSECSCVGALADSNYAR